MEEFVFNEDGILVPVEGSTPESESFLEKILNNLDSTSKKKKVNYVDNEKFKKDLMDYQLLRERAESLGKPKPKMPDSIGVPIILICEKFSQSSYYRNYTYRDEMVLDAILRCVRAVDSFDCRRNTSPFSYFTQVAYWEFYSRIKIEKRKHETKMDLAKDVFTMSSVVQETDSAVDFDNQIRTEYFNSAW